MPCRSEYMEPTVLEKALSRVYQLLDVVHANRKVIDPNAWSGYDSRAYCKGSQRALDAKTAILCAELKKMSKSKLVKQPLELQLWWRDHQRSDSERKSKEVEKKKMESVRKKALAKLTPVERRALGV